MLSKQYDELTIRNMVRSVWLECSDTMKYRLNEIYTPSLIDLVIFSIELVDTKIILKVLNGIIAELEKEKETVGKAYNNAMEITKGINLSTGKSKMIVKLPKHNYIKV